jgi:hypothetical protein
MKMIGNYNIMGYYNGDENHTESYGTHWLIVEDTTIQMINYVSPTQSNVSSVRIEKEVKI